MCRNTRKTRYFRCFLALLRSLMLMMLAPVDGGVPPQNLRYKVFFRMFAQRQKAGSMMRAGSRIMSFSGRLAAPQKRRKAWYLRCFRHFHAFAFGASCKETCHFQGGSAARAAPVSRQAFRLAVLRTGPEQFSQIQAESNPRGLRGT